jgi:integrase
LADVLRLAASLLTAQGASVGYLRRILGHANPAITLSIYAHVSPRAEHDERTRDRMEAAFRACLEGYRSASSLVRAIDFFLGCGRQVERSG